MFDFLEQIFSSETEDIQADLQEAEDLLVDRKADEIDQAISKEESLKQKTDNILSELEEALEQIKEYEDEKDLKVVEDVTRNFYRSRKKMLEDFEQPEDLENHLQALKDLVKKFNDVSRKEGEVIKRVERRAKKVPEAMNTLEGHVGEIESFVDEDYGLVKSKEKVEELQEEIENLKNEKRSSSNLDDRINEKKEEIEEKETEIKELRKTDRWKELMSLEEEYEQAENQIDSLRKELSQETSKMERGLKKLIYSIENSDTSFSGSKKELVKLKDREYRDLENPDETCLKAVETAKDYDVLDQKELKRFKEAVETTGFSKIIERLRELDRKLSEKEKELSQKKVRKELEDLQKEKTSLKKELEELKDEKEKEMESRRRKKEEIKSMETEIEQIIDRELEADVELS